MNVYVVMVEPIRNSLGPVLSSEGFRTFDEAERWVLGRGDHPERPDPEDDRPNYTGSTCRYSIYVVNVRGVKVNPFTGEVTCK